MIYYDQATVKSLSINLQHAPLAVHSTHHKLVREELRVPQVTPTAKALGSMSQLSPGCW